MNPYHAADGPMHAPPEGLAPSPLQEARAEIEMLRENELGTKLALYDVYIKVHEVYGYDNVLGVVGKEDDAAGCVVLNGILFAPPIPRDPQEEESERFTNQEPWRRRQ